MDGIYNLFLAGYSRWEVASNVKCIYKSTQVRRKLMF
jgi:hypothetical protein